MGIRGGKVKSVKALKASVKRGGGNNGLKRVPADAPLTVRFLTEPDEWHEFFEHYDEDGKRFVICVDDCDFCADDIRPSKRVLAPVVDIDEGKVEPLAMPATLVSRLLNKYDKYGTMLDRDYELIRTGKGTDTEYDLNPEDPTRMRLSRFEVPDLEEILEGMAPDDEEEESPKRPAKKAAKKRPVEEDDDEDEDDEDEEDEEFLRPRRGSRSTAKPRSKPSSSMARNKASLGKSTPRPKPRANRLSK